MKNVIQSIVSIRDTDIPRVLAASRLRLFALFLACIASLGVVFAQSGKCGKNLTWNLKNGVLTISGTGKMSDYEFSTIGDGEYSDAPWFSKRLTIKTIRISNGVTSIGNGAFHMCERLTSITIPNSVKSIGDAAFFYCTGLTSIRIPNSVKSIGAAAFRYSALTSVTIPNSVTSIGYEAFRSCDVTSVTISNGVTSIEERAFIDCYSLTSVTIPNSVTSIGDEAFESCYNLSSPIYNSHLFAYMPRNYFGPYTIPNGIETIAAWAFYDCKNLTSVTIPNSVTSIGDGAFNGCAALTSVAIPNSVTSIGERAFRGCRSLSCVTIPNSVDSIEYGVFEDCENLTAVTCYSKTPSDIKVDLLFAGNSPNVTLYVPIGFANAYRYSKFGKSFSHIDEIYVKPAILLSSRIDSSNAQISEIVQQRSEVIINFAYAQYLNESERNRFMFAYSPIQIPDAYDYDQAKAFCDSLQRVADSLSQQDPATTITSIKDYLRSTRPDDFVAAYLKENPAAKAHLESEHKEYRCHYASFTDFVLQYEQGRLQPSERNCRELKWQEYEQYYSSRAAFDADYDKGDKHLEAHKRREIKWSEYSQYYNSREAFDADYDKGDKHLEAHKKRELKWADCSDYYAARYIFDFDYDKGETVVDAHRRRIDETWSQIQNLPEKVLVTKDLKGASESKKEDLANLAYLYFQLKPSPHFQSLAADFLISRNKKLGKEYEKNGAYFSSKVDFLTAYFSKEYKQILKSKK